MTSLFLEAIITLEGTSAFLLSLVADTTVLILS